MAYNTCATHVAKWESVTLDFIRSLTSIFTWFVSEAKAVQQLFVKTNFLTPGASEKDNIAFSILEDIQSMKHHTVQCLIECIAMMISGIDGLFFVS